MKHRKRSRIQFQPQFLVGALSALSMSATACGALVADGPGADAADGAGGSEALDGMGGPQGACPDATPLANTPCNSEQVGLTCGVSTTCMSTVTCSVGLVWQDDHNGGTCNPPGPLYDCPQVVPESGTPCSSPGLVCAEATCGGPGIACGNDGTWQLEYLFCNPPPIGYGGMGGAEAP